MASVIRGSDDFDSGTVGKVLQVVNFQTGAVAGGTTVMPYDDTIPQITEGNEYMTLAITPSNALNILQINVVIYLSNNTANNTTSCALFVGVSANALAAVATTQGANDQPEVVLINHTVIAGSTGVLTFRLRAGPSSAATLTFNGTNNTRRFGGVAASSITITEYTP